MYDIVSLTRTGQSFGIAPFAFPPLHRSRRIPSIKTKLRFHLKWMRSPIAEEFGYNLCNPAQAFQVRSVTRVFRFGEQSYVPERTKRYTVKR